MQFDLGTAIAAGGMVIGAIVWIVRIEGRLNLTEARFHDLKADTEEIKKDVKSLLVTRGPS